jgi:nitrogenase subunit NifH
MPIGIKIDFSPALLKIIDERVEQVHKHGRSIESDVLHNPEGQLIQAARALLKENCVLHDFPDSWSVAAYHKMAKKSYQDRKIIAAALIAADWDRVEELMNRKYQAERV